MLNKHINAYTRYQRKTKEPAILDLALKEGIEIPKVKELVEREKTRKEAILEVSKNMKLQVSEKEVKQWLKDFGVEKPRKVRAHVPMFLYKMILTTQNQTAQEAKKSPFGEKKDDSSR